MKRSAQGLLALSVLSLSIVVGASDTAILHATTDRTFHVGVVARMSDTMDETMGSALAGIKVAKKLFEETHPGIKIDMSFFTHDHDLESVARASDQILKAKVPAVIGGELSEEALMLGLKLEPKHVVLVTPTATAPEVTKDRKFVFGALQTDSITGKKIADFVASHLNADSVGVVHDISSPYTDHLGTQFLTTLGSFSAAHPERSMSISEEKILGKTMDFEHIVARFKEKNVKIISVLTHREELLGFVIECNRQNYHPIFIGCDGWGTPQSIVKYLIAKSSDKNFVAFEPTFWDGKLRGPLSNRFRSALKNLNSAQANAWSAVAFDSAWMLFESMQRAKNPNDGESVREELRKFKGSALLTTDRFEFSSDNSPTRPVHFLRIDSRGIKREVTL